MSKNAALLAGLGSSPKKLEKTKTELDREIVLANFNFSEIEIEEQEFLKEQTLKIQGATTKMYSELGKIFVETQEKLSNNKSGIFEEWYTILGFKRAAVYRLIGRWNYILSNWENKIYIESLPISLSYEISNENCNEELREKVLKGEIKTLKEFNDYKKNQIEYKEKVETINVFEFEDFEKKYKSLNRLFDKEVFEKVEENKKKKILSYMDKIEKLLN